MNQMSQQRILTCIVQQYYNNIISATIDSKNVYDYTNIKVIAVHARV